MLRRRLARHSTRTGKQALSTRILPARVAPRLAIRTSCRNTTWPVTSNRLSHRAARASPKQHFVAARIAGRNSRESGRCGGTLPKNTPGVVGLKTEVEEQGSGFRDKKSEGRGQIRNFEFNVKRVSR